MTNRFNTHHLSITNQQLCEQPHDVGYAGVSTGGVPTVCSPNGIICWSNVDCTVAATLATVAASELTAFGRGGHRSVQGPASTLRTEGSRCSVGRLETDERRPWLTTRPLFRCNLSNGSAVASFASDDHYGFARLCINGRTLARSNCLGCSLVGIRITRDVSYALFAHLRHACGCIGPGIGTLLWRILAAVIAQDEPKGGS